MSGLQMLPMTSRLRYLCQYGKDRTKSLPPMLTLVIHGKVGMKPLNWLKLKEKCNYEVILLFESYYW